MMFGDPRAAMAAIEQMVGGGLGGSDSQPQPPETPQHAVLEHSRDQQAPATVVALFRSRQDALAYVEEFSKEIPGTIDKDGGSYGGRPARTFSLALVCPCGQMMDSARERVVWNVQQEVVYCGWNCPELPIPRQPVTYGMAESEPSDDEKLALMNEVERLEKEVPPSERRVPRQAMDTAIGRFLPPSGGRDGRNR